MKNNEDKNNNYIKATLAKSKTLTKSVDLFMQQNKLGQNNQNPNSNIKNNNQNVKNNIFQKNKIKKIDESDDEDDIEEETNNIDEDDEGIFTYEYVTSNIDRYQKKVTKFDELVKKLIIFMN